VLNSRVLSLLLSPPRCWQELLEVVHGPVRQLAEDIPQVLEQGHLLELTQDDEGLQNGEPARPLVRAGEEVILPAERCAPLLTLDGYVGGAPGAEVLILHGERAEPGRECAFAGQSHVREDASPHSGKHNSGSIRTSSERERPSGWLVR
jgi:hypothetical protein